MNPRAIIFVKTALGFAIVMSGCVVSIDPIVPESEAISDPRLVGAWETSPKEFAAIRQRDDGTYSIEYSVNGNTGTLRARLGDLGGRTVLDIWPTPRRREISPPYAWLMLSAHFALILDITQDEIRTMVIGPDTLLQALERDELKLPYQKSDHQVILRGATKDLRTHLAPYLSTTGAVTDTTIWRRLETVPATTNKAQPGEGPCFGASAWPEADTLFHRDPHWLGADVASTVDLGDGRILWLFGDTWIDDRGTGTREDARMVSNSVAIQRGTDPRTAGIAYYWGESEKGLPQAYFPNRDSESLWPGSGVRVGDRLVLFLIRIVRGTGADLGFAVQGWTAIMVENPDADPPAWRSHRLETPANPLGALVGFTAAFEEGGYVYALGSQDPVKSHPVFVARWPADDVREGNLLSPEWWGGERHGWVPDSSNTSRRPVFENGASELSIHRDPTSHQYLVIQTRGFGAAELIMRSAPRLTGPWLAGDMIYRPPEYSRPGVMIYAAKAHPQLTGADLVVTYATNTFEPAEHLTDSRIYYPRFVRLMRCTSK